MMATSRTPSAPPGRSWPVDSDLVIISAPAGPVYRIAHGPNPFMPRPWHHAHEDGTFGNRFDDPGGLEDLDGRRGIIPTEHRFRTIYCATDPAGAFGETIARFRHSPRLWAALQGIEDDEPLATALAGGAVPSQWRIQRLLGTTLFDVSMQFVDLAAPETRSVLTRGMANILTHLDVEDLDLSAVMDKEERRLTQEIARFVYELSDESGKGQFAGLRYVSRLCSEWELWAVFDDRLVHTEHPARSIFPDDPGLLEACARLGLAPPAAF